MQRKTTLRSRLKAAFLALILSFSFSLVTPVAPTFADPATPDTPATEDIPTDDPTNPDDTPAEEGEEPAENAEGQPLSDKDKKYNNNCTNQTDSIGWLICPTTGVIANAVDALLSIINNFLTIDPISFNTDSPLYTIWDYCRSITNIVFIIILLICIFSQVTGLGFSNYNVKKVLPKVIVSAIIINLSFIFCSLLVDLSNVIGTSLQSFFSGIEQQIIDSNSIQIEDFSVGAVTAAILAGTGIAASVGIVATGGMAAFFWMLVPVLLGALVSVVTGLLTVSMRQAVILLLVMIAPLAVVAYCLPNTEKWFTKWKSLLTQMLIFFPTFSFLFSASRLLGFALIASAGDNIYLVLLGLAVQIFPLFFSWSLLKMSGTILGTINQKLSNLGKTAIRPMGNYATERRALSRARHTATSRMPSASINRWLDDNKARRAADLARYNKSNATRAARHTANVYNSRGQLTRRGASLYNLEAQDLINAATAKRMENELKEAGYRDDGTDARIRKSMQKQIATINKDLIKGVDLTHATDSFVESAKTANARSYAERVEKVRNQVIEIRNDTTLTETERQNLIMNADENIKTTLSSISDTKDRDQYMNNVFANAISAQSKSDKALRDNYAALFAATQLTRNIHADFNKSFSEKNYNAMEAALDELAKRGDFDLIRESLLAHTGEITGEDNVEMQKHLADTLIKYKADSAPLWAYAKSTNIRRAKHANKPNEVALFTTYEEFERGVAPDGYDGSVQTTLADGTVVTIRESQDTTDSLSMATLVKDINNPGIAISQDRTTFKYILDAQQKGIIPPTNLGFQIKQLRSAASSGQIDGEQLGNLNKLLTGGLSNGKPIDPSKMKPEDLAFINRHGDSIRSNIINYLEGLSAGQLASMKESTFNALNFALTYLDDHNASGNTPAGAEAANYSVTQTGNEPKLAKSFYEAVYANAAGNMNNIIKSSMNVNVKNWLGIKSNKQ